MKEKTVKYDISVRANQLNEKIQVELNKLNSISSQYSDDGGLDLFISNSFLYTTPNIGPLVKLNLISVNTKSDGTESKLILKRKNGITYSIHFWFVICFIALTIVIAVFQSFSKEFNENITAFILPISGLIYLLLIELFAKTTISNLVKRVEKIMTEQKIEYKKL